MLVRALELRRAQRGNEHLESMESLSHLGWLRFWQGRIEEARKLHEQTLAVRERVLGPEHLATAWSLYYLGATESYGGNSVRGLDLLQRALPVFERELGPEHLAVAWCLNDIANCFSAAEDHASALRYFRQALEIKEKSLGSGHPDVGAAYGNVGYSLMNLEEAKPYLETALAIQKKSLGTNHLWLVIGLDNLGELMRQMGDHEGARSSSQSALELLENVATEHWMFSDLLEHLALLARDTGEFAAADSLFQRSTARREETNPNDPALAKTLELHAALLHEMDKPEEATVLLVRAKRIRDEIDRRKGTN